MSYVGLKHRLADLALAAAADPRSAKWAPLLAAYARADVDGMGVEWQRLSAEAAGLAGTFGWRVSEDQLDRLMEWGLLTRDDGRVRLPQKFREHRAYLVRQSGRLLVFLSRYLGQTTPPSVAIPPVVWQGVLLFNSGLYFECHELLEGVWKTSVEPEKTFLHGLVQLAAAFYHFEKTNRHGVRTLLSKAARRLESYPSPYLGIDVSDLRRAMEKWTAFLATEEPATAPPIPVISVDETRNKGTPRG